MKLSEQRNVEALILWDCLFYAELKALFGNNTNEERAAYLKPFLKRYKSKRFVHNSLSKVVKHSDISSCVFEVGYSLIDPNFS
jgi:hypothetical protein